jgi:hypothetical protein
LRILFVEDSAPLRKPVVKPREASGYAVGAMGDGAEGWQMVQDHDHPASANNNDAQRVQFAYGLVFSRSPSEAEQQTASEFFAKFPNYNNAATTAWTSFCRARFASAEFRFLNNPAWQNGHRELRSAGCGTSITNAPSSPTTVAMNLWCVRCC